MPTRPDRHLQSWSSRWFGVIYAAFMLSAYVAADMHGFIDSGFYVDPERGDPWVLLGTLVMAGTSVAIMGMTWPCRVTIGVETLFVRNPLRTYTIPISAIRSVDVTTGSFPWIAGDDFGVWLVAIDVSPAAGWFPANRRLRSVLRSLAKHGIASASDSSVEIGRRALTGVELAWMAVWLVPVAISAVRFVVGY